MARPFRHAGRGRAGLLVCIALFGTLAIGALQATGQPADGQLTVRVTDETGAALAGVTIAVRAHGRPIELVTGADGTAHIPGLPPGDYEIEAILAGFNVERANVRVGLDEGPQTVHIRFVTTKHEPPASPRDREPEPTLPPWRALPPSLPAPTTPAPESVAFRSVDVTWNAWLESGRVGPKFLPVRALDPQTEYLFVVDLATLAYAPPEAGVVARTTSASFGEWFREWLETTSEPSVRLWLVLVTTGDSLEPIGSRFATLDVDLAKLRKLATNESASAPRDPLEVLRTNSTPDFVLGRATFGIRTRRAEGFTSMAVSIWGDGRPLDEVIVQACVKGSAEDCRGSTPVQGDFRGIDSARITSEAAGLPNAAFHYLELDGRMHGVFVDNSCPACPPEVFDIRTETASRLRKHLAGSNMQAFQSATSEETRQGIGRGLLNLLVPPKAARARRFLQGKLAGPAPEGLPDSLFVRVVGPDGKPSVLPFALLAAQVNDGPTVFLGERFRIEMPLPLQSYDPGDLPCIARWYLALPPPQTGLDVVRDRVADWLASDLKVARFGTMDELTMWLEDGSEEPGAVLLVVGHHADDRLFWQKDQQLTVDQLGRSFKRPTVVVLNGCGTGGDATGFIEVFNQSGANGIVATALAVDQALAGDYLACLRTALARTTDGQIAPLSVAHFDAVQCVREGPHQSRALAYMLLGNGNVKVCAPGGGAQ